MPIAVTLIREATAEDAPAVAQMLHDFNVEYEDLTPGVEVLTQRIRQTLGSGEITVLVAGEGPEGFALLRFSTSLVAEGLEAYLAELYVVPKDRGRGIGRALMRRTLKLCRERGASWIFLGTSEDDTAARALYESEGFTHREGGSEGPVSSSTSASSKRRIGDSRADPPPFGQAGHTRMLRASEDGVRMKEPHPIHLVQGRSTRMYIGLGTLLLIIIIIILVT